MSSSAGRETIRLLLQHGADVNATASSQFPTPFHLIAAQFPEDVELFRLFLEAKGEPNLGSPNGGESVLQTLLNAQGQLARHRQQQEGKQLKHERIRHLVFDYLNDLLKLYLQFRAGTDNPIQPHHCPLRSLGQSPGKCPFFPSQEVKADLKENNGAESFVSSFLGALGQQTDLSRNLIDSPIAQQIFHVLIGKLNEGKHLFDEKKSAVPTPPNETLSVGNLVTDPFPIPPPPPPPSPSQQEQENKESKAAESKEVFADILHNILSFTSGLSQKEPEKQAFGEILNNVVSFTTDLLAPDSEESKAKIKEVANEILRNMGVNLNPKPPTTEEKEKTSVGAGSNSDVNIQELANNLLKGFGMQIKIKPSSEEVTISSSSSSSSNSSCSSISTSTTSPSM